MVTFIYTDLSVFMKLELFSSHINEIITFKFLDKLLI
jgi:hypothetical protein